MNLLVLADHLVGRQIVDWLLREFREDVCLVVAIADSGILETARQANVPHVAYASSAQIAEEAQRLGLEVDLGLLAWWPKLIRAPLLSLPKCGFINTHPSLLPHNRGKHYNFWALVEEAPFGVTLHVVEEGIDSGDIIAQAIVPYGWEDNGGSLYHAAQREMVELFKAAYPGIRKLNFTRTPQPPQTGSFHVAAEIEPASEIDLDRQYRARDLLNLLRARTFHGHPACRFLDNGVEYEVRIKIERKSST